MTDRPLPVPMHSGEIIDVKTAAAVVRRSEKTIRRLCARHGIARQTMQGAPLDISRVGLEMAMRGDLEALELLRSGDRRNDRVQRYLTHLDLDP